jgi:long-chain fatty acid transport protein
VRWQANRVLLLQLQGQYTFWSDLQAFDVRVSSPDLAQPALGVGPTSRILLPRRWNNTFGIEALASFSASAVLRPFGLMGYRSPAAPDETMDASSPDGHRVVVGGGIEWAMAPRLRFVADLKVQAMVPRDVATSDYDLGNGRYTFVLVQGGGHLLWSLR